MWVLRDVDVLGVRARRAEPPGLEDARVADVDLVDLDLVPFGEEGRVRRELAQGLCRGANVLVGRSLVLALALPFTLSPDDRPERDALLRERIVRQDPFMGQVFERSGLVDLIGHDPQRFLFPLHLLELLLFWFGQP